MKKALSLILALAMMLTLGVFAFAADKPVIAVVPKAVDNPLNQATKVGAERAGEELGFEVLWTGTPDTDSAGQVQVIESLIQKGVDGILIAPQNPTALNDVISEAMDAGIKVVSCDSSCNPASRMTHINQAGVQEVAQCLVDATYDLLGGEGEWAILSATSIATNQNAWIDAMKEILKDEKYAKMNLVEIAYGDDEQQKSVDETKALLQNYPNLKLINAPTTVGIAAASKVITDEGLQGKVIVTGLGLPSEMAEFMTGDNPACPYMFLWNPIDVGRSAAYALIEMVNGKLTGATGESFTAKNGTTYTVTDAGDGGTEIIIGPPFEFNGDNIEEWKTVY